MGVNIMSEPEQKRKEKGKKSKRGRPLNRIQNKEVWKAYKENCRHNQTIEEAMKELNKPQETKSKVEKAWTTVKRVMEIMENWVRGKSKELGQKQFNYIDKEIKNDVKIAEAQAVKKEAWKKYKNSKGKADEEERWRYFKWTKNRERRARKRKTKEWRQKVIKEIEDIKSMNPKLY